jgi:hypothetical protein
MIDVLHQRERHPWRLLKEVFVDNAMGSVGMGIYA